MTEHAARLVDGILRAFVSPTLTTMYREMDMRFYLDQAEAEMREIGA
jgi:hypothetical protein